ncbi:MAG TPA: NADP-dependent phosphogluconate dehydrogenase [Candidatus Dormibacteraeota bacterium]|nr:NADP-dependent phosphogluconate dehydrogenase [Candidatus Dormibacteraeota bacterium]
MGERDVGLIGLGVMGQNLARNLQSKGYSVVVYNRTGEKAREFTANNPEISARYSLAEFVDQLKQPRKVVLMVTAGSAVDSTLTTLVDLLSKGDVVMDCGNSFFQDTERRCKELEERGIFYLGVGVSGGEEGALKGPCIMAGGPREGYELVSEMLSRVAAQVDGPCSEYLGPRSAGHYVKMVHNGIEYAIIQVIAEAYDLLTRGAGQNLKQVKNVFKEWSEGELNSFLMEIAVEVLGKHDAESKRPLISMVLDRAKQKGTGKWTSQNAMDLGIPTPTIDAAVGARNLSGLKDERVKTAEILNPLRKPVQHSVPGNFTERLEGAVRASVIVSYAQGFSLMRSASKEYGYDLPLESIARIWRGGCIVRAQLLNAIMHSFNVNPKLENLLMDQGIAKSLTGVERRWRDTVGTAKEIGVPIPAIGASLDYYDGYRSERLPATLIQLLRDRFGAHGYERTDRPGHFHSDWA